MASNSKSDSKTSTRNKPKDTPASAKPTKEQQDAPDTPKSSTGTGRPDKAEYDSEQSRLKKEIDALQPKLNAVKDKIAGNSKDGPGAERRKELRAELDTLREQQANSKTSRGKTIDQLKALQENIKKKQKDLQAAKSKLPFKSVAEVDSYIKKLELQIDSGSMKLADEKRALQEISQTKRTRKTIENFDKEQASINEDREREEELQKQLADPQAKAASERYEAIKAELDEIKKEGDEIYANRNKLFDERNALKSEIDALYAQKKESTQRYKESNDRYWNKVNEDRARRAEKFRQQKAAEEDEKRKATAERMREEAAIPAFADQIEDCQTLIDHFSGKATAAGASDVPVSPLSGTKADLVGVPKLELRQVEEDSANTGLVARKKKGEDEENYFVGGKGKKKGTRATNSSSVQTPSSGTQLNIPLGILTALLNLSIPAPGSSADVPRVIEDLKTKKAWFEANQDRTTKENIAKAEKDIQRLTKSSQVPDPSRSANGTDDNVVEPSTTTEEDGSSHEIAASTDAKLEAAESKATED